MKEIALSILVVTVALVPAYAQVPGQQPDIVQAEPRLELEARPDSLIRARIRGAMQHIRAFEDVTVAVHDGVVVLGGAVTTAQRRDDARELASRFEGVLWVDNRVEVTADVEQRVLPTVERLQRFAQRSVIFLPLALLILIVVSALWMLGSVISKWEAPATRFGWNPLIWALVRRMARAILVLVGLVLVFELLGISAMVGALLGTAGVVGIVLGFAFREIAENYLAGILLSIRQPFGIRDFVRIGEYEGHVLRLTSRELVLLTLEGNHVRFPNSTVFKSTIVNFSRSPRRRFDFVVGIGTSEPIGEAMQIAREAMASMSGVLTDPAPFVHVDALQDSSVDLRLFAWIDQREADLLKVRSGCIRAVKNAFDRQGIVMPDPQFGVLVKREDAEARATAGTDAGADADVRPDDDIGEQLEDELSRTDEENLLK